MLYLLSLIVLCTIDFTIADPGLIEPMYYINHNLLDIVTPVNAEKLRNLLIEMHYDKKKMEFLYQGFKEGFDLGYTGSVNNIQRKAPNLKFTVGNHVVLWNKIMKEVRDKRFARLFSAPLFKNYVQSLVGLVPKDGGKDTRLIFHLSYPRGGLSVNSQTPKHLTKVKYPDFSEAVKLCIAAGINAKMGKSDIQRAFRNLGLSQNNMMILLLVAKSPFDGQIYWFLDKCLPF